MSNNNATTNVTGDQFIRTLAQFIRANERKITMQNLQQQSSSGHLLGTRMSENSLGNGYGIPSFWSFSTALASSYMKSPTSPVSTTPTSPVSPIGNNNSKRPVFVTLDPHHLYYLLARFNDIGLDIGVFEAIINFDNKDMDFDVNDSSLETASITSINSINSISSAMSSLSLFSGWQGWTNAAQKNENIPIKSEVYYIYKSFTKLTNLKLNSTINNKRIDGFGTHNNNDDNFRVGIDGVGWPLTATLSITLFKNLTNLEIYGLSPKVFDVAPLKIWKNLRQINLSDNALTFIPNEPLIYLTKCTHIDLSNNLLIEIPSGLSQLYNLQCLNLSNNMIETITGIYKILGNVTKLDLRSNRIENLCGLERLYSLEYVNIRENQLIDWAEVTRMTELPEIRQICVDGNPFTEYETNYRINIFKAFKENNKDIILDGMTPTYYEKRYLPSSPVTSNQKIPVAIPSPEGLLSNTNSLNNEQQQQQLQHNNNNHLPVIKHKKFHKRIVNLDEDHDNRDNGDNNTHNDDNNDLTATKHRVVEIEKAHDPNYKPKKKLVKKGQNTVSIFSSPSSSTAIEDVDTKTKKKTSSSPHSDSETILSSKVNDGVDYRKKIEELRNEGGSSWLTTKIRKFTTKAIAEQVIVAIY
ncbi:13860_t:CDS:2 [Entrophospora sp. SA101]|nr:13860_t:CDS:2 [Entrophospora sp. SA101]